MLSRIVGLPAPVPALDLPDGLFGGSVPDGGQVGSDLLVDGGEALAFMPAESCLLLLVDDLVEALVQEDGQPLLSESEAGV